MFVRTRRISGRTFAGTLRYHRDVERDADGDVAIVARASGTLEGTLAETPVW
jgi:hypothetical protein